jgi:uroporphyrin-3 C-methyltransferase
MGASERGGDTQSHRTCRPQGGIFCCLRVTTVVGRIDGVYRIRGMNTEPSPTAASAPLGGTTPLRLQWVATLVAGVALVVSGMLWQRLGSIQEQLARQSADASNQAAEARATSRQAQALAMETAAKLAVTEVRLSEVSLQRTQLEELMQSLSRSRDENLVVDIESALPLKSAELRVSRAAQPRLTPLQRAIARDVSRIKATALADTPALLVKLDELVQLADELPVANALPTNRINDKLKRKPEEAVTTWWMRMGLLVGEEVRNLVRVSRIEEPEAALLSPEQSFFLRENLKLKLLNARLGLLSRQTESVRSDLGAAVVSIGKYFDASSRKTQAANVLLQQVRGQLKALEVPRVDETLAALATAAAGR